MSAYHAILASEALLSVAGPDAATFLQGQLTCDVTEVNSTSARFGAYCNPQGRMVCDFLLSSTGDEQYRLRLRADNADHARATLGKYIIFSKAEVTPVEPAAQVVGVWGDFARDALVDALGGAPAAPLECWQQGGVFIVQLPGPTPTFECHLSTPSADAAFKALATATEMREAAHWEALQHAAGLGRVEASTADEFIPQMLNFDLTGHVSFTKGCYTGQEVVARMHYRGKPKRRMYRAALAQAEAQPGDALFASTSAQSVGNVVGAAAASGDEQSLLVVATADGVAAGLHLGDAEGALLQPRELPYALTTDDG